VLARLIYSGIFGLLLPFIVLRLIWRGHSKGLMQRFGSVPKNHQPCIWVHAVSVGETIAAAPLVKALQQRYPNHRLCITNTTATGAERTRALFGEDVIQLYNPYDLGIFVSRFLTRIQPSICIVMETELWPNMLHHCRQHNIPVIIANARLSAKSARGYQKVAKLSRLMMQDVTTVAVQNSQDGERFVALGLDREKLSTTGSIKFDLELNPDTQQHAKSNHHHWTNDNQNPLWIAASTHKGEDEIILLAHQRLRQRHPRARLILVPRHPERFDNIYHLACDSGLKVIRRSAKTVPADWDIMLGDTMGELLCLLGSADAAFIGGSLVPNGGHNMLEAAIWQIPVLSGPHLFNFQEISDMLIAAGGMKVVDDGKSLADQLSDWFDDADQRQKQGLCASRVVEANRGALNKLLACIDRAMP